MGSFFLDHRPFLSHFPDLYALALGAADNPGRSSPSRRADMTVLYKGFYKALTHYPQQYYLYHRKEPLAWLRIVLGAVHTPENSGPPLKQLTP